MDKETKAALKKEITEVEEWMRESADIYYKAYSLEEMQQNDNDASEIILTFYLNNGKEIEVHNHCARSYISGDYEGDTLIIGDEGVNIEIYHRYNKTLFFYYIPYSAISYIRSYSDKTIWHKSEVYDLYKRVIKKDKDEAESRQESEQPVHPQGKKPHFDYVYCRGTEIITGWTDKEVSIQIVSGNSELNSFIYFFPNIIQQLNFQIMYYL